METSLVCDLGRYGRTGDFSSKPCSGKWTALGYESGEFSGSMVFTMNGPPGAGEVRIPLGAAGRYDIFLGLFCGHAPSNFWAVSPHFGYHGGWVLARVRLGSEEAFDTVSDEYYGVKSGEFARNNVDPLREILEVRWKTATLREGEELVLRNLDHEAFAGTIAGLAYVRLAPSREPEGERNRRLIGCFDSSFWGGWPRNEAELRGLLEPFRASDFRVLSWETVKGENCYYPTRIGRMVPDWNEPWMYPNYVSRDIRELSQAGDPMEMMIRQAHGMGLEFYAALRFMGTRFAYSFYTWPGDGGFFFENRDLWTVDERGEAMPHFSLAFARVREYFLALLQEQLDRYDLDGVNILFNRSYPFVLFEEPFLRSFREEYSEDPRTLDRMDERIWKHRGLFVSEFMKGLRELCREAENRRGRPIKVFATVMNGVKQSRYFGLDVERWVRKGWVDGLILHPCFSGEGFEGTWVGAEQVKEFCGLAQGTGVEIFPDLYPRHLPAGPMASKIADYYEAGAAGMAFWDTYSRFWRKSEWSAARRAGDAGLMKKWSHSEPEYRRKVLVKSIGGLSLDKRYGIYTHG